VLSIEQRVKIVEERMADHSQLFADMRQGLLQFEARVDRRFEQIEARLTSLDQKFEARMMGFEVRLTGLEQKFDTRLITLDQKIDTLGQTLGAELVALRRDMTAQFRWTSGIMLTGLIAIVAAILAK
jgi:phosphoglycerate-specific signal transduction histidine kinase